MVRLAILKLGVCCCSDTTVIYAQSTNQIVWIDLSDLKHYNLWYSSDARLYAELTYLLLVWGVGTNTGAKLCHYLTQRFGNDCKCVLRIQGCKESLGSCALGSDIRGYTGIRGWKVTEFSVKAKNGGSSRPGCCFHPRLLPHFCSSQWRREVFAEILATDLSMYFIFFECIQIHSAIISQLGNFHHWFPRHLTQAGDSCFTQSFSFCAFVTNTTCLLPFL